MAEECIGSLEAPEGSELDSTNIVQGSAQSSASPINMCRAPALHRRASVGSHRAIGSAEEYSTKNSDSAKRRQNVVPHYLRASTGSCHDFCKYGIKHSFEEKAREPVGRRNVKPLPNELNTVQTVVSAGQKKEKVVNHKPPSDTKDRSPYLKPLPDTNSYSPKPKTSLNKANVVKDKPSADAGNHLEHLSSPATKSYQRKPKTSSDMKTCPAGQNKTISPKRRLSSAKNPSPEPPEIIKRVFFPSKNVEVPAEQGSSTVGKFQRSEKNNSYPAKQHSSSVKLKIVKVKPSLSFGKSDVIQGKEQRRNSDSGTGKNITASRASSKNVLSRPATSLSPKTSHVKKSPTKSRKDGNLKMVSPLKDRNGKRRVKTGTSNDEKVSEKTLHVIKIESENSVIEPIPNDLAISSFQSLSTANSLSHAESSSSSSDGEDDKVVEYSDGEASEFISDIDESLEIGSMTPAGENHNETRRKSRVIVSEGEHPSPVKLKFRAGKVVDLQSDNHSPRRLKFRRARVLGAEDSKGYLRKRTLKKGGVKENANGAEISSEKVVLKHQDMEDKKDAQGLFNNVIEETASKLVESRKSKVKALVGAFETVISLQESKPSS